MRTVSFRFDAMTLTLFSPDEDLDLFGYIEKCGYAVRDVKKDDELRKAQGYNPSNAKMIFLGNKWRTLQTREEYDSEGVFLGRSGLIALSGVELDEVPLRKLLLDFDSGSKATRFDTALDLTYLDDDMQSYNDLNYQEMREQQTRIASLCGFHSTYENGDIQNPVNAIRSGKRNKKKPIKTCSKTSSNGLTLYIGSRSSKFMVRMYDKSAETVKRVGIEIAPTLRFEIESKEEHAEAVRKYIINSDMAKDETAKHVWHGLTDDSIRFYRKRFAEELGLMTVKNVQLDYSKLESAKMRYEKWVRTQVAPSFRRKYNELSDEEKLRELSRLFLDKDMNTIIGHATAEETKTEAVKDDYVIRVIESDDDENKTTNVVEFPKSADEEREDSWRKYSKMYDEKASEIFE